MSRATLFERGKEALSQFFGTHTFTKRDTPKIGGSFGGFIALVVCLVLIIIVSSTAVFFLLRDQQAFDQEQARRRRRYQSDTDISSYPRKHTQGPTSWNRRFAKLFGRQNSNDDTQAGLDTTHVKMKRGGGQHGWMRTGSGDWEPGTSEERRHAVGQLGVREVPSPSLSHVYPTRSIIQPSPISRATSDSTSSVRFDFNPVRGLGYPDGHLSPHPTLPNIHSQLSSPSYSPISSPVPVRTTSPEPIPSGMALDDDRPHRTPQPAAITSTFSGGSKFIEDL